MKKFLLGTLAALVLLTGCTEEKKAPAAQSEVTTPTTQTTEVKKEETVPSTQTENK